MKSESILPKVIEHRVKKQDACIVFLHGFTGSNVVTWGKFPELLIQRPELAGWDIVSLGYATKFLPDLAGIWSADAPIAKLATLFRTTLSVGLQPYKSLAILAHSMGGLVVQRALVDQPDCSENVSHVFLFGTPSGGLKKISLMSFFKRQMRDMKDESAFITDLRSRWNKKFSSGFPFIFWTVAGERDEFVPSISSLEVFPENRRAVVPGDHLEIVKPKDENHLGFRLVAKTLLGDAAPAGLWNSASVAVESRDFQKAIHILQDHADKLDEVGLVRLALAYDGVGRSKDAIQLLESHGRNRTDAMGTLAGRLKRRWILEHQQEDYDRALKLYSDAMQLSEHAPDQLYYHAINIAFLTLAVKDRKGGREMAERALAYAEHGEMLHWRMATRGEAFLILGNDDAAIEAYGKAMQAKPSVREIESMYKQALWITELRNDRTIEERLKEVFRPEIAAVEAA